MPYSRDVALDLGRGDNLTLSSIRATVHLGAHTDAPSHYVAGGAPIGARPLERYLGRCQVVEARVGRGQRITPSMLVDDVRASRVLLRTGTYPDPNTFNTDFAALSVELVEHLHGRGVRLIGIDTPSVDLFADKILEAHQAIAAHDVAVLEGIVLDRVTPGLYTLLALPLSLADADASPVRAVLIDGELSG